jgi:hypothetical protein
MCTHHMSVVSRKVVDVKGIAGWVRIQRDIWNLGIVCGVCAGCDCWLFGQLRNGAIVVEFVIGHIVVVCEAVGGGALHHIFRVLIHGACIVEVVIVGPIGWQTVMYWWSGNLHLYSTDEHR